jgi:hypothetical protein
MHYHSGCTLYLQNVVLSHWFVCVCVLCFKAHLGSDKYVVQCGRWLILGTDIKDSVGEPCAMHRQWYCVSYLVHYLHPEIYVSKLWGPWDLCNILLLMLCVLQLINVCHNLRQESASTNLVQCARTYCLCNLLGLKVQFFPCVCIFVWGGTVRVIHCDLDVFIHYVVWPITESHTIFFKGWICTSFLCAQVYCVCISSW